MRQGAEERFEHANLQAHLMVCNHVVASEEFEMRLDLVNVSRKPGFLVKAEDLIPAEFEVTTSPSQSIVLKGSVGMKNRVVNPFQVETLKLKIKASKPGTFTLNPQVSYIDELGETNTYKTNPITITVQPAKPKYELLPGRVSTGSEELDGLLLGGIPEKHALVLTSPSIDERELLIKRFVEAGAKADEIVFDIAQENGTAKALVEEYPSNFYLFICNPQAEEMFQASLNVFKLKGVENLTDIDIALTKAFRMLKPAETGPKRICIEIISDALLQHHAVNTRRWLSALLTTLKLKGFTILAVVDPSMHPAEELQAILGVFDGEIRITEKETPEGTKRTLKIRKLINQKYSDKEIILNKEALSD
jgi:KaiC/GvpD/RAD55 family RecA-like ATPase